MERMNTDPHVQTFEMKFNYQNTSSFIRQKYRITLHPWNNFFFYQLKKQEITGVRDFWQMIL